MYKNKFINILLFLKILPSSNKKWINVVWIVLWTLFSLILNLVYCTAELYSREDLIQDLTIRNFISTFQFLLAMIFMLFLFPVLGYAGMKFDLKKIGIYSPHRLLFFLAASFIYDGSSFFYVLVQIEHPFVLGSMELTTVYMVFKCVYIFVLLVLNLIPLFLIGVVAAHMHDYRTQFQSSNMRPAEVTISIHIE